MIENLPVCERSQGPVWPKRRRRGASPAPSARSASTDRVERQATPNLDLLATVALIRQEELPPEIRGPVFSPPASAAAGVAPSDPRVTLRIKSAIENMRGNPDAQIAARALLQRYPQSSLANLYLGRMYALGIGGEQNLAEAQRLFFQSKEPGAKVELGDMFYHGMGAPKNTLTARVLYVEAGTPPAKERLAHIFETGDGGPQNLAEARRLYAESGTVESKSKLGVMLIGGHGGPKDFAEARRVLTGVDHPVAKQNLAFLLSEPACGPVDFVTARKLCEESGTPQAKELLGSLLQSGSGGPADYTMARRLYAESGTAVAKYCLGLLHCAGKGGPVNFVEARRLFAESGMNEAKCDLAILYAKGKGGSVNLREARRLAAEVNVPKLNRMLDKTAACAVKKLKSPVSRGVTDNPEPPQTSGAKIMPAATQACPTPTPANALTGQQPVSVSGNRPSSSLSSSVMHPLPTASLEFVRNAAVPLAVRRMQLQSILRSVGKHVTMTAPELLNLFALAPQLAENDAERLELFAQISAAANRFGNA